MAVMVKIDGKNLITTIQVNLCCLQELAQNSPEFLLKNFPSTYTISWLPPLVSQLFSHWPF